MSTWTAMDRKPRLGQQLVYLHCRSLFVGDFTRMRRLDSIKNFLMHRRDAIPLLFDGYPLEKVCLIARKLLIDGIFISEVLARQRFPLLFDPARLIPSDNTSSDKVPSEKALSEKGLSEKEASEEGPSEKASSGAERSQINTRSCWPVVVGSETKSAREAVTSDPARQHTVHSSEVRAQVPPTSSVFLPYDTQHRILNNLQTALERTCFDFTREMLPEVIKAQELEVPEQLALKEWVSLLMESADHLPCIVPAMGWEGFLDAAEKLESTIARRKRVSVHGMINKLDDAIAMTQSFNDVRRNAWCQHVREKLQSGLANIEGLEKDIREIVSIQLQNIAEKRAELYTMETKTIAHMMEVEKQNRVLEWEVMKQALPDLDTSGAKVLPIIDGSEPVKLKEEGAKNLQGNLDDDRISNVSAYNTPPKKVVLPHRESQVVSKYPGTVDEAELTSKTLWNPKIYSYPTPPENPNLFSSQPTQESQERSDAQTFSKSLAAEMIPDPPTETEKQSALSQKADMNANVKNEQNTKDFSIFEGLPPPLLPPSPFLFGSYELHKEKSIFWDIAPPFVTLGGHPVRNALKPSFFK